MRPMYLKLQGFHSYADPCELDLSSVSLVAIRGRIGAGKSTLIDAMRFALFGTVRTPDIDGIVASGCDQAEVDFHFQMEGSLWRIWRKRWRGSRSQASLYCWVDGEWKPMGGQTLSDVQVAITQLLGVTERTFTSTVLLGQDDAGRFTAASTPQQRKQILSEILGLDIFDQIATTARDRARETQVRVAAQSEQLDSMTAIAERRPALETELDEARQEAQHLSAEIERLRALVGVDRNEQIKSIRQSLSALAIAEKSRRDTEAQLDQIGQQLDTAKAATAGLAPLHSTLERLDTDLDMAWVDWQDALAVQAGTSHAVQSLQQMAANHDAAAKAKQINLNKMQHVHEPDCPTCGQALHGEAFEYAIRILQAEIDNHADAAIQASVDTETARTRDQLAQRAVQTAQQRVTSLQQQRDQARQEVRRLEAIRESIPAMETNLRQVASRLEEIGADVVRMGDRQAMEEQLAQLISETDSQVDQQQVLAAQNKYGMVERRVGELEAQVRAAIQAGTDKEALQQEYDAGRLELSAMQILAEACGKNGVPARIFETRTNELQAETDRVLEWLDSPYRVRLVTRKITKSKKSVSDTLDIAIVGPDAERDYASYSGGEKFQIDLAIRIGLSQMLMRRSGKSINMLVLDEGWDKMDESDIPAMLQCLKWASKQFSFIATITHTQAVADAFTERIEVVRDSESGSHAEVVLAA